MAGLDVNFFGIVSRFLPTPKVDGGQSAGPIRKSRFEEIFALSPVPPKQLLADEGSYFTANNAQAGLATAATDSAFSATNPFITIFNKDGPGGKRIVLDYAMLLATAAGGTGAANVQAAVVVDAGNRFASGGSALQAISPNMDTGGASIAVVNAGNLTASAASASARMVVGNRWLKGSAPVAGDEHFIQFGAVDLVASLQVATNLYSSQPAPPVIIGPNQTALIYIWLGSQTAASSFAPELGWFER